MKKKIIITLSIVTVIAIGFLFKNREGGGNKKNVYAVLPLTGPFAEAGRIMRTGMEMYLSENADAMFSLKVIDSGVSAANAVSALMQQIATEPHPIVVSGVTSISAAIIPAVAQRGGFTVANSAMDTDAIVKQDQYQRLSYGRYDSVLPVAEYVTSNFNSVAVMYTTEDYGLAGHDVFKEYIGTNVSLVAEIPFSPAEPNVRDVALKLRGCSFDVVYVVGVSVPAYINLFKELKSLKGRFTIMADVVFENPYVLRGLGDDANGIIFPCLDADFQSPTTELGRDFRRLCQRNGIRPYYLSIQSYDAALLIDFMIKNNVEFSQEAIARLKQFDGVGGTVKLPGRGDCRYPFVLGKLVDGKILPVE